MTVVWEQTDCCEEQVMASATGEIGPYDAVVIYCGNCFTLHDANIGGLQLGDGGGA